MRCRHGLRCGGRAATTARTEDTSTAGEDDKVVLHLFLDATCGAVGWRRCGHIVYGRQGPVCLVPHAIQDDLFGNELQN